MARTHARVLTSIWTNDDFRSLDANTQRVYLMLISQPELSICGVLDYNPKRLARLAADGKPAAVTRAVATLEERRYIVVDPDTDELAIRTFLRHDGVLDMPNSLKAAARAWKSIHSTKIRALILDALPAPIRDVWPDALTAMDPKTIAGRLREPIQQSLPVTHPPNPSPEPIEDGPGTNSLTLSRSSSPAPANGSTNTPPDQPPRPEEDLRTTTALIARRKLDLRRQRDEPDPNDVDAWLATVARNDTERLRTTYAQLREQHPDWTVEQLADDLDPDTAVEARNYMNAEESQRYFAEQAERAKAAVPMPEHMRPKRDAS